MIARIYSSHEIEGYEMDAGTIEEEVLSGEPEDSAILTLPLHPVWQRVTQFSGAPTRKYDWDGMLEMKHALKSL
jgi:hypothetical protein